MKARKNIYLLIAALLLTSSVGHAEVLYQNINYDSYCDSPSTYEYVKTNIVNANQYTSNYNSYNRYNVSTNYNWNYNWNNGLNNVIIPNRPSTPSTPSTPSVPSVPSTPSVPNVPEVPSKPVTPPEIPSTPNIGLSAEEQEVVRLVNVERQKAGLQPLVASAEISNVARLKSEDMAKNNYFSHTSPTYGSPFDMLKKFGIKYSTAGENIAKGYLSAQSVMNGWMNSSGHRDNILNYSFNKIGVGAYKVGSTIYWTQMFTN